MATSLTLEEEEVTRLRRAARAALRSDPGFVALLEELRAGGGDGGAAGAQGSSR